MNDTMTEVIRDRLRQLYSESSKHSSYQSIPDFVSNALGYSEEIRRDWRDDRNRIEYLLSQIKPEPEEKWGDFGANTGFFTYSLAHAFLKTGFLAIEANPQHAAFMLEIKQSFSIDNVEILEQTIGFDRLSEIGRLDVLLHFNVLHHAGADFDRHYVSDQKTFLDYAVLYLKRLREITIKLVFQMGSNLWGNKNMPIVPIDADMEKLRLLLSLFSSSGWSINTVAYPVIQASGDIVYSNLSQRVLLELEKDEHQCDWGLVDKELSSFNLGMHVGEFYRRALFILV